MAESLGSKRYSRPALFNLDLKLSQYLDFHNGLFLEIGANDGFSQSNTYFLERWMGWRGILIEPLPDLYEHCRRFRRGSLSYNTACASPASGPFASLSPQNLQSSVVERATVDVVQPVRVATRTLSEIIDDAELGVPDFASVDVEGYEIEVLAGLDMARHAPKFMLVETDQLEAVKNLLGTRYAVEQQLTFHDYLFQRQS